MYFPCVCIDFVPEKLKAKDALAERKNAETENEAA